MKVKVLFAGIVREVVSSNGKTHYFSEVWVTLPDQPYPVQVDHYGELTISSGEYMVPLNLRTRDGRLSVQLDFRRAEQVKA